MPQSDFWPFTKNKVQDESEVKIQEESLLVCIFIYIYIARLEGFGAGYDSFFKTMTTLEFKVAVIGKMEPIILLSIIFCLLSYTGLC